MANMTIHTHGAGVVLDNYRSEKHPGELALTFRVMREGSRDYIGGWDEIVLFELSAADLDEMGRTLIRLADEQRAVDKQRMTETFATEPDPFEDNTPCTALNASSPARKSL